MIPIKIDIQDTVKEYSFSKQEASQLKESILKEICIEMVRMWRDEANVLKQTRDDYKANIFSRVSNGRGYVELRGWLNNRIESGLAPFDMKTGFAASRNIKVNKRGGRYLTIPMRIATPTARAESTSFRGSMPEEVYKQAKQLHIRGQLKKGQIPFPHNIPKTREFVKNQERVFESYTHKSSIYEGITKLKRDNRSNQYMVFRRFSMGNPNKKNNSDPNSWIHTGIKARRLADKAIEKLDIGKTVSRVATEFLNLD